MKWIILSIALSLISCAPPSKGKCTGDDNCTACKNCHSCAFCKAGGTCGVCNGKKPARQYREGYCEQIVDGDTIVIVQDGRDVTVRLIGVDTPETKDPRKPIQYFGKEASNFTTQMVLGKPVKLTFDSPHRPLDMYGRLLAYVHVNGILLNKEIIRQGYGHAYVKYPFDRTMMAEFRAAEREARENKRGLWK
jgi:endonuclease YncB( thermonuclease family)